MILFFLLMVQSERVTNVLPFSLCSSLFVIFSSVPLIVFVSVSISLYFSSPIYFPPSLSFSSSFSSTEHGIQMPRTYPQHCMYGKCCSSTRWHNTRERMCSCQQMKSIDPSSLGGGENWTWVCLLSTSETLPHSPDHQTIYCYFAV